MGVIADIAIGVPPFMEITIWIHIENHDVWLAGGFNPVIVPFSKWLG